MAVTYKYEKPQVKVYQNFTEVNTASVGTQPAFVFGPAYRLFRYNNEDEHDLCQLVDSDGVGINYVGEKIENINYPQNVPNVDTTWEDRMLVYFEEAYVKVGSARITQLDNSDPDHPVVLPTGYYTEKYATYIGVVREDNEIVSAVRAGDYVIDKNYRVEAVYNNPNWVAEPASGSDSRPSLQKCHYIAKINAVIPESVLPVGADPTTQDVLIYMDSVAVPRRVYVKNASGIESDSINWTPTENKITISDDVNIDITRTVNGVPATVTEAARIYVQFRFLDTTSASTIDHIIDISEITGQIDPGNPLWYGVYLAKLNSGECPVYYMSTQGVELERYIEVLKKATLTDDIYVLCPMTDNKEILSAVEGHINEMSGPETKRWRIAFIAPPVEESTDVVTDTYIRLMDAVAKTVMFVSGPTGDSPDTNIHAKTLLAPNDTIHFIIGSTPVETQVYRIINDNLIQITQVPDGFNEDTNAEVTTINHTYTSTELADQIASLARHYADRRMYAVFPDTIRQLVDGETLDVPGYYAAAAVAGLCSSTLPQQPLTNMPITGIDDVPATYEKFDNIELNTMAAGGAFIIAQDLPNDVVYVRHQLSTATYQGNLLTRELSITKNVDSISYYLAESCDDLIGRYNITPELIQVVYTRLSGAIKWLQNSQGSLYGPQLLDEDTEILSVAAHPTLSDHIEAYIRLNPPKPFNVLDIRLTVV